MTISQANNKLSKLRTALSLAFLTFFQFILLYPLHKKQDLLFWDEAYYLDWGRRLITGAVNYVSMVWSPLYVFYYSIITSIIDPIGSMYITIYLITILTTLALTLLFTNIVRNYPIAILLSMSWAMSSYNILMRDRMVYHFALIFFILAILACNRSRLLAISFLILCCLVRGEYLFITAPYLLYIIYDRVINRHPIRLLTDNNAWNIFSVSVFMISVLLLSYVLSISYGESFGSRVWVAFRHHFSIDKLRNARSNLDPLFDMNVVINQYFPNCYSLIDAAISKPGIIFPYIVKNALILPKQILISLKPVWSRHSYIIYVISVLILSLSYIFCVRTRAFLAYIRESFVKNREVLILSGLSVFALLPGIAIHAKMSYSLMAAPFIYLVTGLLLNSLLKSCGKSVRMISRSLHILIAVILCVALFDASPFSRMKGKRPHYEKVMKLKAIWPNRKITMIGLNHVGYVAFIGSSRCQPLGLFDLQCMGIYKNKVDIGKVIDELKPEAVFVNRKLKNSSNIITSSIDVLKSSDWIPFVLNKDEIVYFRKDIKEELGIK